MQNNEVSFKITKLKSDEPVRCTVTVVYLWTVGTGVWRRWLRKLWHY